MHNSFNPGDYEPLNLENGLSVNSGNLDGTDELSLKSVCHTYASGVEP